MSARCRRRGAPAPVPRPNEVHVLFPTIDFAIFFAVVFTVQWLLDPYAGPWKRSWSLASYFFYAWWDWRFIFLLAASTAIAFVGAAGSSTRPPGTRRRSAMWSPSGLLLGLLGWFKYYGFVAVNVDNLTHAVGLGRAVPLVPVDPARRHLLLHLHGHQLRGRHLPRRCSSRPGRSTSTVYLSFFPHLIAGPIVRGTELLPQIRRRGTPSDVHYVEAFWLIMAGLVKKVVLSSYLSTYVVDPVFADPQPALGPRGAVRHLGVRRPDLLPTSAATPTSPSGWPCCMGFRFPVNFDAARTRPIDLQDFWRRWHITLSLWLRDYLYIPLGGNRGSERADLAQHHDHHGARRPVARGRWTFVVLGRLPRGRARSSGTAAGGTGSPRGLPAEPRGPGPGGLGQRFVHLPVRVPGVAVLPRRHARQRVRHARPAVHRLGPASPLVTPLPLLAIVAGIAQPVPARRLASSGPAASSPTAAPVVQGGILGLVLLGITTLGPAGVAPFIYYRF